MTTIQVHLSLEHCNTALGVTSSQPVQVIHFEDVLFDLNPI